MAVDPFDPAEFGGGHGEPSLTAAAAVGSKGMVVCIDLSADMLAFASGTRKRGRAPQRRGRRADPPAAILVTGPR